MKFCFNWIPFLSLADHHFDMLGSPLQQHVRGVGPALDHADQRNLRRFLDHLGWNLRWIHRQHSNQQENWWELEISWWKMFSDKKFFQISSTPLSAACCSSSAESSSFSSGTRAPPERSSASPRTTERPSESPRARWQSSTASFSPSMLSSPAKIKMSEPEVPTTECLAESHPLNYSLARP